jgi:hypothetical protein
MTNAESAAGSGRLRVNSAVSSPSITTSSIPKASMSVFSSSSRAFALSPATGEDWFAFAQVIA